MSGIPTDLYLHRPLPPLPSFPFHHSSTTSEKESTSSSSLNRISPALLLILTILAVIFFVSGLLHLLFRFFIKRHSLSLYNTNRFRATSRSRALVQRQLQELFDLHDSGLDQALIDALPVFYYKDIVGLKEPFDCAICLCQFSDQDKLRLLPSCSHAFHIHCIDTWLLDNSTCPLCRGTLLVPGLPMQDPVSDFDGSREISNRSPSNGENGLSYGQNQVILEEMSEKRVLSVRLGKFRSSNEDGGQSGGSTSDCNLDTRRCYSMGSVQYVVGDLHLQVALSTYDGGGGSSDVKHVKVRGARHENSSVNVDVEGKKIGSRSKGDSLSFSKIWLWSSRFPSSTHTHIGVHPLNLE